jgi:SpoVK/Ycf46/Vps4 family AAA+-type ATPase
MLPKLAAINEERKIVFLLATNYVSQFDAAFSRGGRFDMVIQVMPPTLAAKLTKPEWRTILTSTLADLNEREQAEARSRLGQMTFLETEQLVARLQNDGVDAFVEMKNAFSKCTMQRETGGKKWVEQSREEESLIRLPSLIHKVGPSAPSQLKRGSGRSHRKREAARRPRPNESPA